jgi:hypothetical protein
MVFIYKVFNDHLTSCLRDLARHFKTEPTDWYSSFLFWDIPVDTVSSSQLILCLLAR